jgi:hypothetical protein
LIELRVKWALPNTSISPYFTFERTLCALVGISANTAIADATSIYLRYEGDISGQDSAHAITAGVRMTW